LGKGLTMGTELRKKNGRKLQVSKKSKRQVQGGTPESKKCHRKTLRRHPGVGGVQPGKDVPPLSLGPHRGEGEPKPGRALKGRGRGPFVKGTYGIRTQY